MFTPEQLDGIKWQQIVAHMTPRKQYTVEVTWALDHYRVTLKSNLVNRDIKRYKARFLRTAVSTANRLLRQHAQHEI